MVGFAGLGSGPWGRNSAIATCGAAGVRQRPRGSCAAGGVVGMSRFLIRASVRCQNLASCVQGMALRRIGADYEAQYGYRPWLVESFVDTAHFIGTSYRGANWLATGQDPG